MVCLHFYWVYCFYFVVQFSPQVFPIGDLSMEGNFVSYLDRSIIPEDYIWVFMTQKALVLPFRQYRTALLGIFVGNLLGKTPADRKKTTALG